MPYVVWLACEVSPYSSYWTVQPITVQYCVNNLSNLTINTVQLTLTCLQIILNIYNPNYPKLAKWPVKITKSRSVVFALRTEWAFYRCRFCPVVSCLESDCRPSLALHTLSDSTTRRNVNSYLVHYHRQGGGGHEIA